MAAESMRFKWTEIKITSVEEPTTIGESEFLSGNRDSANVEGCWWGIIGWLRQAEDRTKWHTLEEAYIQQSTVIGRWWKNMKLKSLELETLITFKNIGIAYHSKSLIHGNRWCSICQQHAIISPKKIYFSQFHHEVNSRWR